MSALPSGNAAPRTSVRPPLSVLRDLAGNMDASDVRARLCGHGYFPSQCPFGTCGYREAVGRLRTAEQRAVDDRRAYTDAMIRRNSELQDYRETVQNLRDALKTYRKELDMTVSVNRALYAQLVDALKEIEELEKADLLVEVTVQVEPSDALTQILALRTRVANLQMDKARLDWLLGSPEKNRLMDVSNGRSVPVTDRATLDATRFRRKELGDTAVL